MKREKSCGCIIVEDKKVLLVHQVGGNWSFPKGHIEADETELETAAREVKEETNVEVEIDSSKRYEHEYETQYNTMKTVVFFVAKPTQVEIKPQASEITEIKWFDFDQALETITYDNTKQLFKQVINEL